MFESATDENQSFTFSKYLPVLTIICCVVSVLLCAAVNLQSQLGLIEFFSKWILPSSSDIYDGSIWGLVTTNFLHIDLWHIAFNLYWLWILGRKIEFEQSKLFYFILIISSAIASSVCQLSFSDSTGIGLSGIVYALFGYIYIKGRYSDRYSDYLDARTNSIFLIWLFACVLLTQLNLMNIGNAAHFGGFIWGALLGYTSRYNKLIQISTALLSLSLMASSIFWNPLSVSWLSYKAYHLHVKDKVDEASIVYRDILSVDPDNEFAKENLKLIEIYNLNKKAYDLDLKGNYKEARIYYDKVLELDPDNAFANESIKVLPKQ